jgi:hypothetical protein
MLQGRRDLANRPRPTGMELSKDIALAESDPPWTFRETAAIRLAGVNHLSYP